MEFPALLVTLQILRLFSDGFCASTIFYRPPSKVTALVGSQQQNFNLVKKNGLIRLVYRLCHAFRHSRRIILTPVTRQL